MRRKTSDRKGVDILANNLLGALIPGVGRFTTLDLLRGWRDEFLGVVIADQYSTDTVGAGSGGALWDGGHGGIYVLTAGAVAGAYHNLRLGGGVDTLDADCGWTIIARYAISATTDLVGVVGAADVGVWNEVIRVGANTNFGNNWYLQTRAGGGAWNAVDTGIATGAAYHWHRLDAYPVTGGRRADYFLDGILVATTTVSIPTAVLEPFARVSSIAGTGARWLALDFFAVIPRNLA